MVLKILVIGSGAREYAICNTLSKHMDETIYELICFGNENPGIGLVAKIVPTNMLWQYVKKHRVDIILCVIGPEAYLAQGYADRMLKMGVPTFGPTKAAAMLETSKRFARKFLHKNMLCDFCPRWVTFPKFSDASAEQKQRFSDLVLQGEMVIKADGLRGGKGVFLQNEHFHSAKDAYIIWEALNDEIVVEEKLSGEEFSLISFTDGTTTYHAPIVKDYKRSGEGNVGPNTGGMGSVSFPNHSMPFLTNDDVVTARNLNSTVARAIASQTNTGGYRGVIYGGYMKTTDGNIKILEYNCRFGDPEAINILTLMESNFLELCMCVANGTLATCLPPTFREEATCCRYYCPPGYPDPENTLVIETCFDSVGIFTFFKIYFANMISVPSKDRNDVFRTTGSRSFALIECGSTLSEAISNLDELESQIPCSRFAKRQDIGKEFFSDEKYLVHLSNMDSTIRSVKDCIVKSWDHRVVSRFGDYAGMFCMGDTEETILVASTDGVGTKSELVERVFGDRGFELLGHDLVNHCVNDIIVKGATPMFFTNYFASSKIKRNQLYYFLKGVSDACIKNGMCNISGETAEMEGVYTVGATDLVGNIVGEIKGETNIICGKRNIQEGDIVFGISSSGPHTNGYTLIRKLDPDPETVRNLCSVHRSYLREIRFLKKHIQINGLIHITGGGYESNPPRVLPDNMEIEYTSWDFPPEFKWIQEKGGLSDGEMKQIFNCGFGMLIVCDPTHTDFLKEHIPDGQCIGIVKKK